MSRRPGAPVTTLVATLWVALLVALLASCSGDGDPGGDATPGTTRVTVAPSSTDISVHEYVEALAEGLVKQEAPMDEGQARCFSDGLMDVVGLERARAVGSPLVLVERTRGLDFSSLEISRKEAEVVYDQFEVCGVDLRKTTVEDVTEGVTPRQERCLARAVTGDRVREYYLTHMVRGPVTAGDDGEAGGRDDARDDRDDRDDRKPGKGRDDRGDRQSEKDRSDRRDRSDRTDPEDGTRQDRTPRDPGDSPLMRAMITCLR